MFIPRYWCPNRARYENILDKIYVQFFFRMSDENVHFHFMNHYMQRATKVGFCVLCKLTPESIENQSPIFPISVASTMTISQQA